MEGPRRQYVLPPWCKDFLRKEAPQERVDEYLEILDNASFLIMTPFKIGEDELINKALSVSPGSVLNGPTHWSYEWRPSRVPFYVELKISKPSEQENFTWFSPVDTWPTDDQNAISVKVVEILNSRQKQSEFKLNRFRAEGIEENLVKLLSDMRNKQAISECTSIVTKYLLSKGLSKGNIESVSVPVAQLICQAYNEKCLDDEVFAVTWASHEANKALQTASKTKKKRKTRTKKKGKDKEAREDKTEAEDEGESSLKAETSLSAESASLDGSTTERQYNSPSGLTSSNQIADGAELQPTSSTSESLLSETPSITYNDFESLPIESSTVQALQPELTASESELLTTASPDGRESDVLSPEPSTEQEFTASTLNLPPPREDMAKSRRRSRRSSSTPASSSSDNDASSWEESQSASTANVTSSPLNLPSSSSHEDMTESRSEESQAASASNMSISPGAQHVSSIAVTSSSNDNTSTLKESQSASTSNVASSSLNLPSPNTHKDMGKSQHGSPVSVPSSSGNNTSSLKESQGASASNVASLPRAQHSSSVPESSSSDNNSSISKESETASTSNVASSLLNLPSTDTHKDLGESQHGPSVPAPSSSDNNTSSSEESQSASASNVTVSPRTRTRKKSIKKIRQSTENRVHGPTMRRPALSPVPEGEVPQHHHVFQPLTATMHPETPETHVALGAAEASMSSKKITKSDKATESPKPTIVPGDYQESTANIGSRAPDQNTRSMKAEGKTPREKDAHNPRFTTGDQMTKPDQAAEPPKPISSTATHPTNVQIVGPSGNLLAISRVRRSSTGVNLDTDIPFTYPEETDNLKLRSALSHRRSISDSVLTSNAERVKGKEVKVVLTPKEGDDIASTGEDAYKVVKKVEGKWISAREPYAYQSWATNLAWRYMATGERVGTMTFPPTTVVYLRPKPWRPWTGQPNPRKATGHYDHAAVIMPGDSGDKQRARFEWDPVNLIHKVWPHQQPLEDLRKMENHPDWLPPRKLCEHQAVEVFDYEVWRSDRNYHQCALPSCRDTMTDHDLNTILCLQCGPQSIVRYCSRQHQAEDLPNHWPICGGQPVWLPMNYYVEVSTFPSRYENLIPALVDVTSARSHAKARQRLFAIWNKGEYTLFRDKSLPSCIKFPNDKVGKMAPRVERLLNMALTSECLKGVVRYLYQLLRMGLRSSGSFGRSEKRALQRQFKAEFGLDAARVTQDDPCECVWFGDRLDRSECTAACRKAQDFVGEVARGPGLLGLAEKLEAKYWLLRVWQRQHPTVPAWRERLRGVGFPGIKREELEGLVPVRGRGWDGHAGWGEVGLWRKRIV